ncbi:MAG TPA: hypothetical protein V6C65_06360 [Allocoleopsis sp.]
MASLKQKQPAATGRLRARPIPPLERGLSGFQRLGVTTQAKSAEF